MLALLGAVHAPHTGCARAARRHAASYCAVWWEQTPRRGFLLPALAVLAAVGGVGAAAWLARRAAAGAALVLAIFGCAAVAWLASSVALTRQLLPVTVGAEGRGAFLQRLTGTYDALHEARADAGEGTIGARRRTRSPTTSRVAPSRSTSRSSTPPSQRSDYLARLRSLGVTSLLVGNGPAGTPQLDPVRELSDARRRLPRAASSRHGRSARAIPYDLVLYSLVGCA